MGQALGAVLPLAVAVAIFPVPVIAVVLVLGSERGTTKGLAFVVAWSVGLAAVGTAALLFAGAVDARDDGKSATWVSALLLGLGVVLLVLALRLWRERPRRGEEAPMPVWMQTIDRFTVAKAGATGFALSALNPKNMLLTVAAAAEIAAFGLPAHQEAVVLAAFVLIASIGVLAPLVLSVALGARSDEPLESLTGWMARHNAAIVAVLFLLIGAKLIGDAIAGFSA